MEPVQRLTLPVRRVLCRYDKKAGRFVPVEWGDSRGTLLTTVDQAGRNVVMVHGDRGEVGYALTGRGDRDSAILSEWIKSHPKVTREERQR